MIAIGALGGSGTRAVARVFIRAGVYMGDDLNAPKDNLMFTRLFKNPTWYRESSLEVKHRRMRIFEKYMRSDKLSLGDVLEIHRAARAASYSPPAWKSYRKILKRVLSRGPVHAIWGWKEPNTHIYASELLDYFDQLKYIHVLRHGLDMAFSRNKRQLFLWGWKYGIRIDESDTEDQLAIKQLDYWIATTKDAIGASKKYPDRILFLNHSSFCRNPETEVNRLLDFAGIRVDEQTLTRLYEIPGNTGSNNRYLEKDLSIFRDEQLQFVREMGFEIQI